MSQARGQLSNQMHFLHLVIILSRVLVATSACITASCVFCLLQVADASDIATVDTDPRLRTFRSPGYLLHNSRRLQHLASLELPLAGKSVLELGAGPGDHTEFYLQRGCRVMPTDGRPEIVELLRERFSALPVDLLDLDEPPKSYFVADVVHSYGVLYHVADPAKALSWMANHTRELLLLETCVSFGRGLPGTKLRDGTTRRGVFAVPEKEDDPSQALRGVGVRPTRHWVFAALQRHFPHVYMPITQPRHWEFPLDWSSFVLPFEKVDSPESDEHRVSQLELIHGIS